MKILADATLPNVTRLFSEPFRLTLYDNADQLRSLIKHHEILVCRSTLRVTPQLLAQSSIDCVATASSGSDHIERSYLEKHHITLLDAQGCNARAVADYVITCLAALESHCHLNLSAEHKVGIIGMGSVGQQVEARFRALGHQVLTYDPLRAFKDRSFTSCPFSALTACDLLCIHANLHSTEPFPSHSMINADFLAQLKPHTVLLNAARGGIVDEEALLKNKRPLFYCTDVYCNEPFIDARIVQAATLCTPHIAGHSIEGKQNAVIEVSKKIYAHYQIPLPLCYATLVNQPQSIPLTLYPSWQKTILNIYDPFKDTQILKQALDKQQAFLVQRAQHQQRHDFIQYSVNKNYKLLQQLM